VVTSPGNLTPLPRQPAKRVATRPTANATTPCRSPAA